MGTVSSRLFAVRRWLPTLVAVAILGLAGCQSRLPPYQGPTETPAAMPGPAMNDAALRLALTGNTLITHGAGGRSYRHFAENGKLSAYNFPAAHEGQPNTWAYAQGAWSAEQGRLCLRWAGAKDMRCFVVAGDGRFLHGFDARTRAWAFNAEVILGNPLNF